MGRGTPLRIPQVPIEWMGVANWKLPSGKALAEFALQAGFISPWLIGEGPFWRKTPKRTPSQPTAEGTGKTGDGGSGSGIARQIR